MKAHLPAALASCLALVLAPDSAFAAAKNDRKQNAAPTGAATLRKEITPAPDFEATIFATSDQANYPVFVAAAPDGTLYVSSDADGSLGRDPHRGRILRLRDTDGDGRADEVKVFVADVDSPRGLIWDHDRLYLLHPPHISVYFDQDGDGVAEEEKVLVKNIAFTFKDRPADHTSNGIELGIDGWIYCAIGDFGFMEAEGTDGRKLQCRGGGVVRVRPDGSGLELFSYGTRNILETAVSPLLDIFARDNTNDGGGWDVRFHHFTGLENHGYPKLFKNFADEIVKPLADYGGGSGCGAAWIDEPGFPADWNNLPYTCDWGRGPVFRHTVRAKGATFEESSKPVELLKMSRSTDLDVDAMSRVYVASWRGGGFNYSGPDVGFIARVTPKGFVPDALPDFAKASEAELIKLLESSSHRRRMEAQRTLLRRGVQTSAIAGLQKLASDKTKLLPSRVAAVFALQQGLGEKSHAFLGSLSEDPSITPWAIRALTDHEGQLASAPAQPVLAALKSADPRARREAVVSMARLGRLDHAAALTPLLADGEPVIAHTAVQALARLRAADACFASVDRSDAPAERVGALGALQLMHEPGVVDGLLARLAKETDSTRRQGLLTTLCRLHSAEGQWKGESWGTRPDTRGPYYKIETWSQTPRIASALSNTLAQANAAETAFLSTAFTRHRIAPGDATGRMLQLLATNPNFIDTVAGQLAAADTVPAAALPALSNALRRSASPAVRADAAVALTKIDNAEAVRALLDTLPVLWETPSLAPADLDRATSALLGSPFIDKYHPVVLQTAKQTSRLSGVAADAALIKLAARTVDRRQKAPAAAARSLEEGWQQPDRRRQIIQAMAVAKDTSRAEQLVAALADTDGAVKASAEKTIKTLKLDPARVKADAGRTLAGMKNDDLLNAMQKTRGEVQRGEQIFTQIGCVVCHTVKAGEPLKGPFLGNIATTYKRRELGEAILFPNKSIAQGFATHRFQLKDGEEVEGFVIQEAADQVTIRNVAAQEVQIPVANIAKREKVEKSLMPEGLAATLTLKDFASLLDYLEALAGN